MAILSAKLILVASGALSYVLVQHAPESLPPPLRTSYIGVFASLCLVQFVALFTYAMFLKPFWLSPLTKLPQPKGGGLLNGHFKTIYSSGAGETEKKWFNEIPNDGLIYYRGLLNNANVIVTSPETLQEVLTRTYEFPKPVGIIYLVGRVLGIGLVLSEGDVHKQQRRTFLPAFAPRHVRDMYPIFWSKACQAVTNLTYIGNGEQLEFEVGHWASRTAIDIITMAMMGKDFGAIADANAPLFKVYRALLEPTRAFLVLAMMKAFFPAPLVDRLPVKWNRWMDEAVETIRGTCRGMLREKKQKLAEKSLLEKDFLSIAVQYEDIAQVSEDGVIDQLTNALGAGHDDHLRRHYMEEVRTNFPSPTELAETGREATASDVDNMPLLQAFINETLRRFPPVPVTARWATNDSIIAGQLIPSGTRIAIPIKAVNWDKRLWGPDAHEFKPERWLGPDGKLSGTGGANSKYSNLTFLQGTRACVAQVLVKAEMACVVGSWVGRFDLSLVDETLLDEANMKISGGSLSGKPLHGLHVKARVLEGW
ncbi:hypothetical protein VE04_03925 [Pseudogymnoascus sp. 24MN13]|nr:hypothetical protein VE04_03925 [Pseudogymnoascus sp. 24MN13]